MYLSTKEHDQLRTIVMGFEVPFRTFIARRLISIYETESDFANSLNQKVLTTGLSEMFSSEFGKLKASPSHYYKLLIDAVQACSDKCVSSEINVPNIATLITLYEVFNDKLADFMCAFSDHMLFVSQMEKYKYVRNKLDHPQSKTLETEDMYPVLAFVKEASISIFVCDENCFWDKQQNEIENEVLALETKNRYNPIECNNFSIIPFSENSIVCRQQEIDNIKWFVYGKPGALKKKDFTMYFWIWRCWKNCYCYRSNKNNSKRCC